MKYPPSLSPVFMALAVIFLGIAVRDYLHENRGQTGFCRLRPETTTIVQRSGATDS